jgi:hypothetical protein
MPKLTNISVTTVKTAVYVRRNLTTVKKYITIGVVLFPSPEPLLLHNWNVNALVQENQLNLSKKKYHNDYQEDWLEEKTECKAFRKPEKDSHNRRQEDDGANIDWETA